MRARGLVAAVSILAALAPLAAGVRVTHEEGVDLSAYRTYAWSDEITPAARAGAQGWIVTAVERELAAKGLHRVGDGAELLVRTVAYAEMDMARRAGYTHLDTIGVGVITNDVSSDTTGNLVVELIDAGSGRSLWRGVATDKVDTMKPKKARKKIDKLVGRMFEGYPPE